MKTFRILITGSRDYSDKNRIRRVFINVMKKFDNYDGYVLISGACPTGADRIAEEVAKGLEWKIERYPAEWSKHGKNAGPKRNQEMVNSGADICLAFPTNKSIGTWDCTRRAEKAGILTKIFK